MGVLVNTSKVDHYEAHHNPNPKPNPKLEGNSFRPKGQLIPYGSYLFLELKMTFPTEVVVVFPYPHRTGMGKKRECGNA